MARDIRIPIMLLVLYLVSAASAKDYTITVLDKNENLIRNANVKLVDFYGDAVCDKITNRYSYK